MDYTQLRRTYRTLCARFRRVVTPPNQEIEHPEVIPERAPDAPSYAWEGGAYYLWQHQIYLYSYKNGRDVSSIADIVSHEHLHALLYKLEGQDACEMLDYIVTEKEDMLHKHGE